MKPLISASLMCVDLMNVERDIRELERLGIEYFHIDIMDFHFVPNVTLSPDFVKALREITKVPLDIHLMTDRPEAMIEILAPFKSGEYLTVHHEGTVHIQRALDLAKQAGALTGAVLNPGTPLAALEDLYPYMDAVMLMTVNPGFAGQRLVESTLPKIRRLRDHLDEEGYKNTRIEVDGNVSFENAVRMRAQGADMFVVGSSSLFKKGAALDANAAKLRECLR